MKPAAFDYMVADSVDAAVAALGRGEAKILAGGQSLVPMLNFRLLRPVDPGRHQPHPRSCAFIDEARPRSESAR